jgi:serine/threonine-protein kinase
MDDAIPKTTPPQPAHDLPPEEIDWTGQVLGEFRVMHRLGRGGMGQVYLAEQTNLKRKVALKILNRDLAENQRSLARFKTEAENVGRATHANIVQVYTIGLANGTHYIALEYVEGKNLREFIERKGTPDIALGLHIMSQVASALQRATELGIIHRDIKPENILLTKKGEVKVADFGLSRCFTDQTQQSLTQSQVTMGTPLYMSPEQVERRAIDHRSDVYSFGVTCYHMFAGTPPFRGTSPIEVAYQHVHKEAQPLAEIRPDLPPDLCMLIQKMMAKKPEDRYQTAREIVRDIERVREAMNLGTVAAISISSSFLGANSDGLSNSATQTFPVHPPATSMGLGILAGFTILLALAAGLTFGWYYNQRSVKDPDGVKGLPPIELGLDVKPSKPKSDEKELQSLVQKYLNADTHREVMTGTVHAEELGRLYLDQRRYDDAGTFFKDLGKSDRKPAFRYLGRLGVGVVLAYKDETKKSNDEFLIILAEMAKHEGRLGPKGTKKDLSDEVEAYKYVWKDNPPMRELVAKALNRNFINDEKNFPSKELDVYRFPPKAFLKPVPPPPPPMP